jgi:hypothetical protein
MRPVSQLSRVRPRLKKFLVLPCGGLWTSGGDFETCYLALVLFSWLVNVFRLSFLSSTVLVTGPGGAISFLPIAARFLVKSPRVTRCWRVCLPPGDLVTASFCAASHDVESYVVVRLVLVVLCCKILFRWVENSAPEGEEQRQDIMGYV